MNASNRPRTTRLFVALAVVAFALLQPHQAVGSPSGPRDAKTSVAARSGATEDAVRTIFLGEMEYPVDTEALRAEFRATGEITLAVPVLGYLRIVGAEDDQIVGPDVWYRVPPGGGVEDMQVGGEIRSLSLDGHVAGHPGSDARLLLGKFAVMGTVSLGDHRFEFDLARVGDAFMQSVEAHRLPGAAERREQAMEMLPTLSSTTEASLAALTLSTIRFDAEASFWNSKEWAGQWDYSQLWDDYILSALNNYDQMWEELGIDIDAFRLVQWPTTEDVVSMHDCEGSTSPSEDYQNWLFSHSESGPDAYQAWIGEDLLLPSALDNRNCFGAAEADTVGQGPDSYLAAGVLEGADLFGTDGYDPDESYERGVVSGHENAHVYGEENHWDRWYDPNNIMECGDGDTLDYAFLSHSKEEIKARFFNFAEYGSSPDNNC